jgi:hypothetical protein
MGVKSPKRSTKMEGGRGGWYSYYAGYSGTFVLDVLNSLPEYPTCVLDPWNGSGTTTQVMHDNGVRSVGYDLNPVMVLIAKARLLYSEISPSEISLCKEIVNSMSNIDMDLTTDPLARWFRNDSVVTIRSLERAIAKILIPADGERFFVGCNSLRCVSSLASFFYVALFRVVRELLKSFRSSNPTWILTKVNTVDKFEIGKEEIKKMFLSNIHNMSSVQFERGRELHIRDVGSRVDVGVSTRIDDDDASYDLVITSPPYCTRIDYAVATMPELSVLGFDDADFDQLRRRMIGTTTVNKGLVEPSILWGRSCSDLLGKIYCHGSYASKTYYYKNYVQYFDGLYKSLLEVDRVLVPSGKCVLVVQDSYYKDLYVDLAGIVAEMGGLRGWEILRRYDFPASRNMSRINSKAIMKRVLASESVLVLKKTA